MNKSSLNRRNFLSASAAAATIQIVPAHVLGGPKHTAPSDKLHIAGIGVGGMGGGNINNCAQENIVALCDVDHKYAARTLNKFPKAKRYKHYAEMLESQKDIDAVVIATPDHTHAVISMAAMKAGKHVYCQKPLTQDLYEARMLAAAAKKYGVTTQMGIQGHSGEGHRLISEWIRDGAIGEIREIDAWCSLMYSPPGHASWSSPLQDRPVETPPVPEGLDWDTWIGPAPLRPYHRCYHPTVWRCWWDFGCGMMGDRGAHTLDSVYSAMKLVPPTTIEASGIKGGNLEVHPDEATVVYHFPQRGTLPPLKLTWREGSEPPRPQDLEKGRKLPREGGVLFKGEKGTIMCGVYGNHPRIIPEAAMKAYKRPPKTLARVRGTHEQDWIRACKADKKSGADFSYAGPLTELCLLGNIAKKHPGKALKWNNEKMVFENAPAANAMVRKTYRKGWKLG